MKKMLSFSFVFGLLISLWLNYPDISLANTSSNTDAYNLPSSETIEKQKEMLKNGEIKKVDFNLTVKKKGKTIWKGENSEWGNVKYKVMKKHKIGKYSEEKDEKIKLNDIPYSLKK